ALFAEPPPGWVSVAIGRDESPIGCLAIKPTSRLSADDMSFLNQIGSVLAEGIARRELEARMQAAEAGNRENAELLRQVLDSISTTLISVRDADGNYLVVNRAMAEMFGSTIENMQGRNVSELWAAEDVRMMRREDKRVLRSWKPMYNPDTTFTTR